MTIVHRGAATKISRRAVAMKTGRRAVAMKTGPPPFASRWANSGATPAKLAKVCAEARWTVIVAAVGVVVAAAVAVDEYAARMTVSSGPMRPPPIAGTLRQATASEAHPSNPTMPGRFATRVSPTGPTTKDRRRVAATPRRAASVKGRRALRATTIRVPAAAAVDAVAAADAAGTRRMAPAGKPPPVTHLPAGRLPPAKATTNRFRRPTACDPGRPARPAVMPRGPTGPPNPRKARRQRAAKAVVADAADAAVARDARAATVNPRLRHPRRTAIRASHAREAAVAAGRLANLGRPPSHAAAATTSHRSPAVTTTTTRASSSSVSRRLVRSRLGGSGPPRTKTSSSRAASTRCSTCRVGSRRSAS